MTLQAGNIKRLCHVEWFRDNFRNLVAGFQKCFARLGGDLQECFSVCLRRLTKHSEIFLKLNSVFLQMAFAAA